MVLFALDAIIVVKHRGVLRRAQHKRDVKRVSGKRIKLSIWFDKFMYGVISLKPIRLIISGIIAITRGFSASVTVNPLLPLNTYAHNYILFCEHWTACNIHWIINRHSIFRSLEFSLFPTVQNINTLLLSSLLKIQNSKPLLNKYTFISNF